jgi:hypothetical protein
MQLISKKIVESKFEIGDVVKVVMDEFTENDDMETDNIILNKLFNEENEMSNGKENKS